MLAESATGIAGARLIANERLAVPAHFDTEVYAAFRRHFRQGLLARARLELIVSRLAALAAERVALPPLLREAHALADRLSAADAFYVALARTRKIALLTADARLAQAGADVARIRLVAGT